MSHWKACLVKGCLRTVKARGLCDAHYKRLAQSGTVRAELPVRSLAGRKKT